MEQKYLLLTDFNGERYCRLFSTIEKALKALDEEVEQLVANSIEKLGLSAEEAIDYQEEVENSYDYNDQCLDFKADPNQEWTVGIIGITEE